MVDKLSLKWGTLKGWKLESAAALAAAEKYASYGISMSAMMQNDGKDQKQALCDLIDAVDCETIHNDWSGDEMTKEQAKKYVMEYGVK